MEPRAAMNERTRTAIRSSAPPTDAHAPDEIRAALQTRGCPVCDHLACVTFEYFCHIQRELVGDESVQEVFARAGGLCSHHARQFVAGASPLGLSIGCRRWVLRVGHRLRDVPTGSDKISDNDEPLVATPDCCRLCALLSDAQGAFVTRLAAFVSDADGREFYARAQGVCLPHLEKLRPAVTSPEAREFVAKHAGRRLIELAELMRRYAEKREALQRHLLTEDERDACLRAILHLTGDRRVFVR